MVDFLFGWEGGCLFVVVVVVVFLFFFFNPVGAVADYLFVLCVCVVRRTSHNL